MNREDPGGFWLLLVALAALIPSIWLESSLTGGDEHRISFRTALETADSEDWTIPTYNGEPRLRKPPLYYWALAATTEWFGATPFSLRIWGVLCGALLAVLVARWGQRICGADPLLTFLIMLSTIGLATESRRAMLDIPMTLFLLISMKQIYEWKQTGQLAPIIKGAAFLAIASLIKPTAPYFAATGIATLFIFQRQEDDPRPGFMRMIQGALLGVVVFLAIFLPWWLHALSEHRELLLSRLDEQVERREFSGIKTESIPSLLGGLFGLIAPWSIAALAALFHFLKKPGEGLLRPERWLVVWIILSAIPFLFMKTFERYLIPILPAMAILVSSYLDSVSMNKRQGQLLISAFLISLPAVVLGFVVGWFFAPWMGVMTALVLFWLWRVARQADAINTALTITIVNAILLGLLLPALGIGANPDLPRDVTSKTILQVGSQHLPLLDLRLQSPVPVISIASLGNSIPSEKCYLVISQADLPDVMATLKNTQRDGKIYSTFGVLRSRKTFTRFARPGSTREDWIQAFEARSLEQLKSPCVLLEVAPND